MAEEEQQEHSVNGQDKGKEKATEIPDHETHIREKGDKSMISRIGSSAAGLSRSILQSRPTANDIGAVATSGKAEPSSSRPLASAESSSVHRHPDVRSTGGFRSAQTASHIAAEESAFSDFLDSTPVFVPTEPANLENAWQKEAPSKKLDPANQNFGTSSSIKEQQTLDGQEVVDLLSQPEIPPDPNDDVNISEAELASLRKALFDDDNQSVQLSSADWNNALNFIPDFLLWPEGEDQGTRAFHDSSMHLGVRDPTEAGQAWLEQWNRVLTSYNDEVWGDLGALVQEAREEVKQLEEASPEQPPPQTKAIRRLRQVLAHVRPKL